MRMAGTRNQCASWFSLVVGISIVRLIIAVVDPGIGMFALFDAIALFITVIFYFVVRTNIRGLARDAAYVREMGNWDRRGMRGARYLSVKSLIWLFVIILSLVVLVSGVMFVPVAAIAVEQGRCMFPVQLLPFEAAVPLAIVHLVLAVPHIGCLVLLGRALLRELGRI